MYWGLNSPQYNYLLSHIFRILFFVSIKTLFADAVIITEGIIRLNIDAGATNIDISSSGFPSA